MTVHDEVETTYEAALGLDLSDLLERLAQGVPDVHLDPEPTAQTLDATYFDTVDLRLARAGLTLRRRTGGADAGWHLKIPTADASRAEVQLPLARSRTRVPAPLRRMVRARSLAEPLVPVVCITTQRTAYRLLDERDRQLAELADDRVKGTRLRAQGAADDGAVEAVQVWRELEVELVDGSAPLLPALDEQIRALGLVGASGRSKPLRVLGEDLRPQESPSLAPTSTAGVVVLAYLSAQVEQMRAFDPRVRLDRPDSVHKMRVATRRLRSALKTFAPLLDTDVSRELRTELKWLVDRLGQARDAEVLRARLARAAREEPRGAVEPGVTAGAEQDMAGEYRHAHDELLHDLDSERYHRLVHALTDLTTTPPLTETAYRPAGEVLPDRVRRAYRGLNREVAAIARASPGSERDRHLHEARKQAKKARYAAEAVTPAFGKHAKAFAAAMEALQEELGAHQDSVVMRERLLDRARTDPAPEAGFAYGRLFGQEEARGQRAQERFETAWKTAEKKRLRRWLR